MDKLLYLTSWDFTEGASSGITNKILGQIKAFRENGFEVNYTYIKNGYAWICEDNCSKKLGYVGKMRKFAAYFYFYRLLKHREYRYVYNRYALLDRYYFKLLQQKKRAGSTIIVEIPTFPYDSEQLPGMAYKILYYLDKRYRNKLSYVVDQIATYSEDQEIYGIKTIHIVNGIDFDRVSMKKTNKYYKDGIINIIGVAGLQKWHGYDRLINGLGNYYENGGKRRMVFHIVGDGPVLSEYKDIVQKRGLSECVVFYGVKTGDELNQIYDLCDLGVEELAAFRQGEIISSSLKSREYAAKGLPFITSSKSDIFNNEKFVLKLPENEEAVCIEDIIEYYDGLYAYSDEKEVSTNIRNTARQLCNIIYTMEPVCRVFLNYGKVGNLR